MKFTKHMVDLAKLFVEQTILRRMYYIGVGVAYLFAAAAFVKAIRWW